MTRRRPWAALVLEASTMITAPALAATLQRSIHDMSLGAPEAVVHVGDVIEWTNDDFVVHTVTARDGSFDVMILPGKTGRTVLSNAGKVAFYCRFHPTMTGTIEVMP